MKLKKRVLSLIVSAGLIFTSAMPAYTVAAAEPPGNAGFSNYVTVSGTKLMDGENELRFVSLNYPQATSDSERAAAIAVAVILVPMLAFMSHLLFALARD